jgi:hypothetical protein
MLRIVVERVVSFLHRQIIQRYDNCLEMSRNHLSPTILAGGLSTGHISIGLSYRFVLFLLGLHEVSVVQGKDSGAQLRKGFNTLESIS